MTGEVAGSSHVRTDGVEKQAARAQETSGSDALAHLSSFQGPERAPKEARATAVSTDEERAGRGRERKGGEIKEGKQNLLKSLCLTRWG